MLDKTDPVCERFGVDHQAGLGELSITAVYKLVNRVVTADKPVRVLYISDFDPAGECMPISVARKIEWFIRTNYPKLDIMLMPLALTKAQCIEYGLPRTPIKDTEKRKTAFEGRYGEGATELDALEALYPGVLANLLQEALIPYFDEQAFRSVQEANEEVRTVVHDAVIAHADHLTKIIEKLNVRFKPPQLQKAQVRTDENRSDWLFDSKRNYVAQLTRYKMARVSS